MMTKYGRIPSKMWEDYKGKLVNKVYKILPMKEEKSTTIDTYISSLIYELIGDNELMGEIQGHGEFITIIATLENLIKEENIAVVKREVFKSLDIIKKI